MGRETTVDYVAGKESVKVRAHLDSMALQLSGGKKLVVPLGDVRVATVIGDDLRIEAKGTTFALRLGAKEAAAWAKKILNPPTLADKLGLKADTKVLIVGQRVKEIDEAAGKAERATALTAAKAKLANIILLTLAPGTAEKQIAAAAKALGAQSAIWFVYIKGTKPNGDDIIMLARKAGLKDTKVARISETHAALRFIRGDRK